MRFTSFSPFDPGDVLTDEAIAHMKGQTTTLRMNGKAIGEMHIVDAVRDGEGVSITFDIDEGVVTDELKEMLGQ